MGAAQPTTGLPPVSTIGFTAPFGWLKGGWSDLQHAAFPCFVYGLALSIVSILMIFALTASNGAVWAVILSCGFVFLAPMLAMGVYEAGRLIQLGERPKLGQMLFVRRAFRRDLAYLGFSLLMIYFLWGEIGRIIYGLSTRRMHKSAAELIDFALNSSDGHSMLITGSIVGGIIAYGAYCVVVISAPMLLDRKADFFIASITSVRAVVKNPLPMALWALIIAIITTASLATAGIALIVTLPWLGLASWRAYRELVPEAAAATHP